MRLIKDIKEIEKYLKTFFLNSNKEIIEKCNKILKTISNNKISYFQSEEYKNEINPILIYFKQKAYKYNILNNSLFFMTIYRNFTKQYEDNENNNNINNIEEQILFESENKYNELKQFLEIQ